MNLRAVFEHQRLFNQQIFKPIQEGEIRSIADINHHRDRAMDRLRHLALGLYEETGEFLRTYEWKSHRKRPGHLLNVAHSHEELIDMFKYWLSMADLADFSIDQLEELYYAKSRVVQYRYQEEWIARVDPGRYFVIVDIDNVLADYAVGLCSFAREFGPRILGLSASGTISFVHRLRELQQRREWINADSVGMAPGAWLRIKHEFRTSGWKRKIPVFSDAKPFLDWCRNQGWVILLVTSRPIDQYPNLFTDTLTWLETNQLPFDHLWWATEKMNRVEEITGIEKSQIVFAVDDGVQYVKQYVEKGVKTYWLVRAPEMPIMEPGVQLVRSLDQLVEQEMYHPKEGAADGRLR